VNWAFDLLDRDQSGIITIDDLRGMYDTAKNAEFIQGKKTEDQVLQEFLDGFESFYLIKGFRDGNVTKAEFQEYYSFISASIDNEEYFEHMITKSWGHLENK
jgi:calcyphosin